MKKNPPYTHLFGTIRLSIFSKISHLYVYLHLYFYSFLLAKEISKNFCYIKPFLKPYFCMKFNRILNQNSNASRWFPMAPIRNSDGDTKMESKLFMVPYRMPPNFPPILLFRPVRLLDSTKFSYLYFYSVLYFY